MESSNDYGMLLEMGFSEALARRALEETGNSGIEVAIGWISENDEKLDEDGVAMGAKEDGVAMGAEGEEYRRKIDEMRKKQDREAELEKAKAEVERRKVGREMQSMKQSKKTQDMLRAIEQRNREKREDEEYMGRLKREIEEEKNQKRKGGVAMKVAKSEKEVPASVPIKRDGGVRVQVLLPDSERLVRELPQDTKIKDIEAYVREMTGMDYEVSPMVSIEGYESNATLGGLGLTRGVTLIASRIAS